MRLDRFKPGIPKNRLLILAGLMWSVVGIMLCYIAIQWLRDLPCFKAVGLEFFGIALSLAAFRFTFAGIARKNIERINLGSDVACLFSFQAWKGYFIIVFMIILGVLLRASSIPKYYLAVVYTGIGGALFMASVLYYIQLWRISTNRSSADFDF